MCKFCPTEVQLTSQSTVKKVSFVSHLHLHFIPPDLNMCLLFGFSFELVVTSYQFPQNLKHVFIFVYDDSQDFNFFENDPLTLVVVSFFFIGFHQRFHYINIFLMPLFKIH